MTHAIQPATTGRSKCRGCGGRIEAGALRLGESLPNPFGEGETTHWFHVECAAYKRPEPFLEAVEGASAAVEDADRLKAEAKSGLDHPRMQRVDGAERDPSGRAQCRSCRERIEKGSWRIRLMIREEDRFVPAGFIHVACARAYFETADVLPRVRRFSPALSEAEVAEVASELERTGGN